MEKNGVASDDILRAAASIIVLVAAVLLGPSFVFGAWAWKNPQRIRHFGLRRLMGLGLLALCCATLAWAVFGISIPHGSVQRHAWLSHFSWKGWIGVTSAVWGFEGALTLLLLPLLLHFRSSEKLIGSSDFSSRVRTFNKVLRAFDNPREVPIGINLKSGAVVSFEERRRTSHTIVLGATGSGKTVLLCNQVLHAIRHGQPCLVIDPKGEDSTLQLIRDIGEKLSSDFNSRLRVFRMSNPADSCSYNPLKHGNAIQLKDRILEALNWSEQYYQSLAGNFLTVFTACNEKLGTRLTLDLLSRVLGEKKEQHDVLRRLKDQMKEGDAKSEELFRRMSGLLEKMKPEDLLGLQAQLSILNSPSIGHKLSFEKADNELDLREVLERGQLAYFQLDTLGNPDTARRLGRMIVEDLKSLASEVYRTVPEGQRKFFPVFIDEFGSFASREFIEVLKQIRGAGFAMHLFSQGLEDLDVVSKEFRRQASSNPITKIAFRLDDKDTVNEISAMAGTAETVAQSYQVEGTFAPLKTGLGNLRETRQMKVEHDVFKNLEVGQAVVIEKSPSSVSAVEIFHPRVLSQRFS